MPNLKTPEPTTTKETPKENQIIGEVILGQADPKLMTESEFNSNPELLFHGTKDPEFQYSPHGEFDISKTDGNWDYGSGFYLTDNRSQAENYSKVRQSEINPLPIVKEFLPYKTRMLDFRNKDNPEENGYVPNNLVIEWCNFLINDTAVFEEKETTLNKNIKQMHLSQKRRLIENIKKALKEKKVFELRAKPFNYASILGQSACYHIVDYAFRNFILSKGYDGIIYREGGEGEKAEPLTAYLIFNPGKIGTFESWHQQV